MGKQVKRSQRQAQRRARRLPRCPLCGNEITEVDVVKIEVEGETVKVHKTCGERFDQAKLIKSAQRLQDSGIWLPGDDFES
jgi:transcription elongation factor Elf1